MRKLLKRKVEISLVILIFSLLFGSVGLLWVSNLKLPDLNTLSFRQISESTKIYDRTGTILLYDIHQNIKRTVVKSNQISTFVKQAAVTIEDDKFYEHIGIRPLAFIRAALVNLITGQYSQGGSTITQQVIKNSILTSEKSISRKIKEWILAMKLERVATKEEILTLYLNEAPYGGNIYGIEEASLSFFGKHANKLSLAESAYLAALPNAPTFYSPYGTHKNDLEKRKNSVLKKMFKNKIISKKELDISLSEKVKFLPSATTGIKAPHFVMYIKSILEKKYGIDKIENEGLKVITTLDYELQQKAEEIVRKYAYSNEEKFNAKNAGIVAINAKTGEILTMVGSRDYFDNAIDGNFNVTTTHRQPGSSFKPFVYATAFKEGYTPDTVVFDVPTEFSTFCNPDGSPVYKKDIDKCYMPTNYDHKYRGPISFKEALAQSVNIPALKALYLSGIKESLITAQSMGITSLKDSNQYGLTLVLGGGEVSLLEMTSAYAVFADKGIKNNPIGILRVENNDNKVIFKAQQKPKIVLDRNIANQITDMLSDEEARAPAFGYNSPLHFNSYDVAAKTGTTNDYRDAWILGYTTELSVGAWAGNNDNTSMEKKVAGFVVAPMWHDFMKKVIELYPPNKFEKPQSYFSNNLPPVLRNKWKGGISTIIDSRTGQVATNNTPTKFQKETLSGGIHSILYWINKNNPQILQVGFKNDPQFNSWEYGVLKWVAENPQKIYSQSVVNFNKNNTNNTENNIIPAPIKPFIYFKTPDPNSYFNQNEPIYVSIGISHTLPIKKVTYFINGKKIKETTKYPFDLSFVPETIVGVKGFNSLRVVVEDIKGNTNDLNSSFRINN